MTRLRYLFNMLLCTTYFTRLEDPLGSTWNLFHKNIEKYTKHIEGMDKK